MDPADQLLHVRLGHLGQAHAGEVRVAQLQHPGAQREVAAVASDVAQLHERQQEPPGRGPGEAGGPGHLRQRQPGMLGVERADHRQPPVQRLDEVAALRPTGRPAVPASVRSPHRRSHRGAS